MDNSNVPKTMRYFKKIYEGMKLSDFKVNKGMEDLVKNKEVRYCDIHNKVLEFYCTDDREEICAHCGIKGDH